MYSFCVQKMLAKIFHGNFCLNGYSIKMAILTSCYSYHPEAVQW